MSSQWFQAPFNQAFPLAFVMRYEYPDNWLRIHSLPKSKRYAENDAERKIVLHRYTSFATALLGENAPCLMIQSKNNGWPRKKDFFPGLKWTRIHQIVLSDEDIYDSWAADVTWNSATFRDLLQRIADDEWGLITFISKRTDGIFTPYDGGSDGFSFDTALIARLREEFSPWRSSHPEGL